MCSLEIFLSLICQVTPGLSLHSYLRCPRSLVLLLLQLPLVFIWLDKLSACRKGYTGPELPGILQQGLEDPNSHVTPCASSTNSSNSSPSPQCPPHCLH